MRFDDDVILEPADIIEINVACSELCNKQKLPHLVVTGLRMSVTPEARAVDIIDSRVENTLCEALIINNLATRMAARLYYKFNKVPFEVKHFKTENDALQWIRVNYLDENEGTKLHSRHLV